MGAAWVFTRSPASFNHPALWTQQSKLVGSGAVGGASQGNSVALSADGNTAVVGGTRDNNDSGAAWVFTRGPASFNHPAVWIQQGNKLVGTGAIGAAFQGNSVALSADGNIALVGGPGDNLSCGRFRCSSVGAAWLFTRSNGGVWAQQRNKVVGTGAIGAASQGTSVALSADAKTAIVGGPFDNSSDCFIPPFCRYTGAAWVFVRP
jgi:hypothetical protein